MAKKLLIVYNFFKIGVLILFLFWEFQALWNDTEYRYQYLLLFYIFLPVLLIFGIVEVFLLKKVIGKHTIFLAFPFFTALVICAAIFVFGDVSNTVQVSWNLIVALMVGVALAIVKSYKLIKLPES